jgi:hypothetical protein
MPRSIQIDWDNTELVQLLALFWEHVDKKGPVHRVLGSRCWVWTADTNIAGYGQFSAAGHAYERSANRFSWVLYNGPIPQGMFLLHRCDNPACVNPAHMVLEPNRVG